MVKAEYGAPMVIGGLLSMSMAKGPKATLSPWVDEKDTKFQSLDWLNL